MNQTKIKRNYKLKFLLQMHQIFQSLITKIIVNFKLQNKKIMKENISSQLVISMKSMSPLILSPGNLKQSVANTLDCSFVSQFSIAEQSKENINNQNVAQVFRKERALDRIAVSKQLIPQDIEQTEKQRNPKGCLQSVDSPIQMISASVTEENIFHQINNSGNSDKQISEISNEGTITEKTKNNIFDQNGTGKDKLSDYRKNNGIGEVDSEVSMIRQCNRVQSFLKQKDFIRKQKEEIKRQYEQRYNKMWSQSIKKDHIIIRLQLRNNDLQKQVKEGNEQLEQLKKGSKRQLQLLKNQFQIELNEQLSKNKQNQEKIKQSYDQKLKFLTEKFETLEEESRRINAEKESMETRYRKKLQEVTQDGIQLARRVKQCMERKLLIIEERHQSEFQALREEHRLQYQILQSELTDYKLLLQAKTQIIRQQSILIEDLSPMNQSQQPVPQVDDFSQNQSIESKQIQFSELIKFIAVKLQEQKERQIQIMKQNYEDKFMKLVEKNISMEKEMQEVRERLRMRLNPAQMSKIIQIERTKGAQIDKIGQTSEDKQNYQQKQQESIEEKQQTFSPIKSKNEETNQAQYELLKKDLTLTRTQLSLCRQQLSLYQSIIESLQLQLSQLQSINQKLSQKNDGLTNLLYKKKKETLTDENSLETTLSRNDFNQEWNRKESLLVKSMEEEFNSKYHQLQLANGKLQDQYSRTNSELQELKKQSFQTKVQHQALCQQYQGLKNQIVTLQRSEDQTKKFIAELKEIHQLNIKQIINSYERLLLQRQQEVEQLSLIIGQVIKQNFEIRRSYNILKHEGDRKKQDFNEDNMNKLIN